MPPPPRTTTTGRAADAGADAGRQPLRVFEIGMNHPREIVPLRRRCGPRGSGHHRRAGPHGALRFARGDRRRQGRSLLRAASGRHRGDQPRQSEFARLHAHALASKAGRIVTFGEHDEADVRARRIVLRPDLSVVDAVVLGQPVTYQLGTPGRHTAMNSLGVMAVIHSLGADLARAALSLAALRPPVGRGERTALRLRDGEAFLVDESYNANPASVRAALSTLGGDRGRAARTPHRGARRHAGTGLGRRSAPSGPCPGSGRPRRRPRLHRGPFMGHLFEALPVSHRGIAAGTSDGLIDSLAKILRRATP